MEAILFKKNGQFDIEHQHDEEGSSSSMEVTVQNMQVTGGGGEIQMHDASIQVIGVCGTCSNARAGVPSKAPLSRKFRRTSSMTHTMKRPRGRNTTRIPL